jgi:hypothetical protein
MSSDLLLGQTTVNVIINSKSSATQNHLYLNEHYTDSKSISQVSTIGRPIGKYLRSFLTATLLMSFRTCSIPRISMPSLPEKDHDFDDTQLAVDIAALAAADREHRHLLQQLASTQEQLRSAKAENNRLALSNRDAEYRILELMHNVAALQLEMDQAKMDKLKKDLKMATDPELAKLFELQIALLHRKMAAEEALRKQQCAHSSARRTLEMAYQESAARKTATTLKNYTREPYESVLPCVLPSAKWRSVTYQWCLSWQKSVRRTQLRNTAACEPGCDSAHTDSIVGGVLGAKVIKALNLAHM